MDLDLLKKEFENSADSSNLAVHKKKEKKGY